MRPRRVEKVLKIVSEKQFCTGDLVAVKNSRKDERFCIIGLKINEQQQQVAVLKALFNDTYIIEKPLSELISLLIKGRL
jgi:hypothetical protein